MKAKFFLCTTCGNVAIKLVDSGADLSCCGDEMMDLLPDTTESLGEKHLPVLECDDKHYLKVKIGSVPHPMTKEHRILFICLETEHGGQIQYLEAGKPAEAVFCICCDDKPVAVYAYCNIHGLWMTKVNKCH